MEGEKKSRGSGEAGGRLETISVIKESCGSAQNERGGLGKIGLEISQHPPRPSPLSPHIPEI